MPSSPSKSEESVSRDRSQEDKSDITPYHKRSRSSQHHRRSSSHSHGRKRMKSISHDEDSVELSSQRRHGGNRSKHHTHKHGSHHKSHRRSHKDTRHRHRHRHRSSSVSSTSTSNTESENNDSTEDSHSLSSDRSRSRKKKHRSRNRSRSVSSDRSRSRKKKHRSRNRSRSISSDRSRSRKKKHRSRNRSRSVSSDRSRSRKKKHRSSSRSRRRHSSHHHKKDKRDKSSKKSKRHSKHSSSIAVDQSKFGKYGIIHESNFYDKNPEFDVWMREVKGINETALMNKRDLRDYFSQYCEDYNTATLPHEKFYNLEAWDNKQRRKQGSDDLMAAGRSAIADELLRQQELSAVKARQQAEATQKYMQSMDTSRLASLKEREKLQQQMEYAYKSGNMNEVERVRRMLAPS